MAECQELVAGGCLYLVATPIGNLSEISPRTRHYLQAADCIAAEDTRISLQLLRHLGLSKKVVALHAHNEKMAAANIMEMLRTGQSVAYVSDAGMPGISDPGNHLIALAHQQGVRVVPISGPSAIINAVAASGWAEHGFIFLGFLSRKTKLLEQQSKTMLTSTLPVVVLESPERILATLNKIAQILPPQRLICICREMTKLHETIRIDTIEHWLAQPPLAKGEFTLVIQGAGEADQKKQIDDRYHFYKTHTPMTHLEILNLLAIEFDINVKRLKYHFV